MGRPEATRRAVLRGLAAAGLLGAVRPVAAWADTGSASGLGPLAAVSGGGLTTPLDPGWTAATRIFNSRFDDAAPLAVVAPTTVQEVVATLGVARDLGLRVAVRSGGHSYIGASAAGGAVVLDLRRLTGGIVVDPETVTVTPGSQLGPLQRTLAQTGRSVPVGTCPTVGVGGSTLGGGIGIDSRTDGLTCDRLVSVDVVLPSGEVVTATTTENPDLFWASRGGGGAVGVVVAMTLRTASARDRDVVAMTFADADAPAAVASAVRWTARQQRDVWATVTIASTGVDDVSATVLMITAKGQGTSAAADLVRLVGADPRAAQTTSLDPTGTLDLFARYSSQTPHPFVGGSDILRTVDETTAIAVVDAVRARRATGHAASAIVDPLDGAVTDLGAADTAFPWRGHTAVVQWIVDPLAADDTETDALAWLTDCHARVADRSDGGYANYAEAGAPADRWFGANTARLADTRRRHDPDGRIVSPWFD
ncbi:FAD-binding oxidoreductase [Williamsia serinedens]|uniref:FAD/FMN-containing dehydrogenase n=1 Tax=Williamsia serinedens TaxID=391736 RepID=A0ABT1H5U1_9NOCA|nr:FAD-dependent oxidoreductase [Williamsia serinedens]MCP2162324.1 FAD/FMN-containing dehydrogenase [Williamsia serinedens]